MTTSVAITAVLAVAQTMVVTRNIDLSARSIVGVSAYLTGEYAAAHQGAPPVLAIALALGIGALLGAVNGLMVAYARVPAIIVTLGTLAIYRSWLVSHAEAPITADSLPSWVVDLPDPHGGEHRRPRRAGRVRRRRRDRGAVGGGDAAAAVGPPALRRRLEPRGATQAGLPTRRLVFGAFVACGALSGLAGFLFLARFGTITVVAGQGLELDSVAAAVVGGVSVLGGSGTLVGALLGAVLIDVLDQSLVRVPRSASSGATPSSGR